MIKLHISRKGQTPFPKPSLEWLGVEPGGDVLVELSNGQATLKAHTSAAGMPGRSTSGRSGSPSENTWAPSMPRRAIIHANVLLRYLLSECAWLQHL